MKINNIKIDVLQVIYFVVPACKRAIKKLYKNFLIKLREINVTELLNETIDANGDGLLLHLRAKCLKQQR